ncbi:hypothetical protein [Legionella qingyii]|uniref:hypothetical protein n=1 Tax=Legionella qingyii TaxID=2184757 RepID=UPI001F37E694|nr:hypothetical protein [Legionella qingyii]
MVAVINDWAGNIMVGSKQKLSLTPRDPSNDFKFLSKEIEGEIAGYLSIQDLSNLAQSSITTYNLFKPNLDIALALKARMCVVQGDVAGIILIAKRKPDVLFDKGHVTDPRQRNFYQVSAYQLILFLCDSDMKNQIIPYIPPKFAATCEQQSAEMGTGGADLIKLDRDPLLVAGEDFQGIIEFKTKNFRNKHKITFPLLENPDGIIYYQDDKNEVHFYYANRKTREVRKLHVNPSSEQWDQLHELFDSMENNSGRRSNDAEHQLIAKTLQYSLQRDGIQFEHEGVHYRDSRTGFKLINHYRTCERLYVEADRNGKVDDAHTYWCKEVGKAQGEEMWLLQRICEENRPFDPLPLHFNEFRR